MIKTFDADVIGLLLDPFICPPAPQKPINKPKTPPQLEDKEIISIASQATNSPKFNPLWKGSTAGYESPSQADQALANLIAFYATDASQISRLMWSSGLVREKWTTNAGYLPRTIAKAMSFTTTHYEPSNYHEVKPRKALESQEELEELNIEDIQKIRDEHVKSFGELPELPDGFFRDYMEYGKRMNYAYPAFHLAGALTIVSLICGRRVVMKSTAAEIYPNTYIMCIGATSTSGKSTANDMVASFFSLIRQEGAVDELPKKLSPQGLLQRLSKIPCRYWPYDECSEFFSDSQAHWGESLESNLCSIYDGRSSGYGLSVKKNEESEWKVKDAFVSALWNTTDANIEDRLQMRSVSSGLVPRFLWFWCHGDNPTRMNRDISQEDIEAEGALQRQIWTLRDLLMQRPLNVASIRFKISPILEKWAFEDTLSHRAKEQDMHRVGTARLVPQAYKIAMMFSMMDSELQAFIQSKKPEEPIYLSIPEQYAELAKEIAEHYFRPRLEYVINVARFNDSKNYQDQIRKSIEKHGTIATKSQIIRDTRIPKRNLEEALETMIEGDVIKEYVSTDAKGRPGTTYQLIPQTS